MSFILVCWVRKVDDGEEWATGNSFLSTQILMNWRKYQPAQRAQIVRSLHNGEVISLSLQI
jgi:hypothetical protein